MKRFVAIALSSVIFPLCVLAQNTITISGSVLNKKDGSPVEFATIVLDGTGQWAMADAKGNFTIKNVQKGKNVIEVSCLGFVTDKREVELQKDLSNYRISLSEDNLTLESVVVTSKENSNSAATSRTIDKTALDHIQIMNVADISSLMPGGATGSGALTANKIFSIRGSSIDAENSAFGTAVEVDGVRLSSNASFASGDGSVQGVSVNNVASANVESVEVITGVPSVEYGDMTNGVVKINTQKGKTPWTITLSTNPNTKQASLGKGFGLGKTRNGSSAGVMNASAEYTRSINEPMSPYTSYSRAALSLNYNNLYSSGILADTPLRLTTGLSGSLSGLNTKADPDSFKDTFTKSRADMIRGNFSLNWLLSKSWITSLELNAAIVYNNKQQRTNTNYSSAMGTVSLHAIEEGYFLSHDYNKDLGNEAIMIPKGYWYNTMCDDDKPLNYKIGLKANWAKNIGEKISNKIKLGLDFTGDGNFGVGKYSEDIATAPSFFEYRYCDLPWMNNLAVYLEENFTISLGKTRLNLIAGLRNDNTFISGSQYGNVSSLSPRFNAKYTIISAKDGFKKVIKELSIRAGWGVAVKQPGFGILYPTPTYFSSKTFDPTSTAEGNSYSAWFVKPRSLVYNPNLRWQRSKQTEVGLDINIDGFKISLAGYYNKTKDAYMQQNEYESFAFNYTSIQNLEQNCTIPLADRSYGIDRKTGIITVNDKTGAQGSQTIPCEKQDMFLSSVMAANNDSDNYRYGLEWIIDFKRIAPINTTIRLDGSFNGYKSISYNLLANSPTTTKGTDGNYFKYVGYYVGGAQNANGTKTRNLNTNLTITTNIPKVRMVISLRLEASLLRFSQNLSENPDGSQRGYILADKNDFLSYQEGTSIYSEGFSVVFPEYYKVLGDDQKHPFLEDFKAAKTGDPKKFTDLSRLAQLNATYTTTFMKDYISPYFAANISVTKEIGDIASISFYANNFFYNNGKVKSSRTGRYSTAESYAPDFFYGLTLRFKF